LKYKVMKRFKPHNGFEPFEIGSDYETDNKREAEALAKAGLIEKGKEPSLLDGNVSKVKEAITSDLNKEELRALKEAEKEGDNRKSVIKHFDSLLDEEE
jgi:hypothetical protein